MSLTIGELVALVSIDASPAETAAAGVNRTLGRAGSRWSDTLGQAGQDAGEAAGDGLWRAADGRLRNAQGQFAAAGEEAAEAYTSGFSDKAKAGLAAAAAAVGVGVGMAISEEMNIEAGVDRITASLGLTQVQSERAGAVAGKLYAGAYGESMEDVNLAVESVISSFEGMRNASTSHLQRITAAALDFATAMELDVGKSAQIAGQMVVDGLAKGPLEAFDLLTKASQKVPASLREDILDAAHEYGPFFAQLGYSGEQAMSMLVDSSKRGMFGIDKMGDAVKEFSILVQNDMARTKPIVKDLGLNYNDTANAMLAGGKRGQQAIKGIVDGLLEIKNPAKQARYAVELFGTPLEDLGTGQTRKFLQAMRGNSKAMKGFKGSTEEAGKTLADNASTNLTAFTRQVKSAFVNTVGGAVIPIVNELAASLATGVGPALAMVSDAFSAATQFLQEHQTVTLVLATAIASFLVPSLILMALEATRTAAKTVAAWVMQRVAAMQTVASFVIAKTVMVAGWALMGAKALLGAAKVAASWLIALGPIGIVIALVAVIVAVIVKNWDKIKKATTKVWGAIVGAVKASWKWISDTVGKGVKLVATVITIYVAVWRKIITTVWNAIKAVVKFAWTAIVTYVKTYVRLVMMAVQGIAALAGKFAGWFGAAKDKAVAKLSALVEWARGLPGRIISAVGNIASSVASIGTNIVTGIMNGIRSMGSWLVSQLTSWVKDKIPGPIAKALGIASPSKVIAREVGQHIPTGIPLGMRKTAPKVAKQIAKIVQGLLQGIKDGVKNPAGILSELTEGMTKKQAAATAKAVRGIYKNGLAIKKAQDAVAAGLERAKERLANAIQTRDDFARQVLDAGRSYGSITQMDGTEEMTAQTILAQRKARLKMLREFRQNMQQLLKEGLDRTTYEQMVSEGVDGAGAAAQALVDGPAELVKQVAEVGKDISDVAGAMGSEAAEHLYQAGVDAAQGIVDGLLKDEARLKKAADRLGTLIANAITNALAGKKPPKPGGQQAGRGERETASRTTVVERNGPLIGQVIQAPDEPVDVLAQRLHYYAQSRGY